MEYKSIKSKTNSLPVIETAYKVLLHVYAMLAQFPQNHKPVLGNKIANLSNTILENLMDASFETTASKKMEYLNTADINIQKLILFIRFAKDLAIVSFKQYEVIVAEILNTGKQIGGWKKWQATAEGVLTDEKIEQQQKRGGVFYNFESPIIKKYVSYKIDNPYKIIAIKVGTFYKLFFKDAKYFHTKYGFKLRNVAQVGVTDKIEMCGFPVLVAEKYKVLEPNLLLMEPDQTVSLVVDNEMPDVEMS